MSIGLGWSYFTDSIQKETNNMSKKFTVVSLDDITGESYIDVVTGKNAEDAAKRAVKKRRLKGCEIEIIAIFAGGLTDISNGNKRLHV
jgi:hypothetical protein